MSNVYRGLDEPKRHVEWLNPSAMSNLPSMNLAPSVYLVNSTNSELGAIGLFGELGAIVELRYLTSAIIEPAPSVNLGEPQRHRRTL